MKAHITTLIVLGFLLFQSQVFSQDTVESTPEPIKVTKGVLTKLVEELEYCVLMGQHHKLTKLSQEGYLKNLAFIVSDLLIISDLPRTFKGSTKDILDKGTNNIKALKMALQYYNDNIESKRTPEHFKKIYEGRLERIELALKDYYANLVVLDAHEQGSIIVNLGSTYVGNRYTVPILLSVEKALYPSISVGGYFRYFMESNRSVTLWDEMEEDLCGTCTSEIPVGIAAHADGNRFKYASFGLKASYHLTDIVDKVIKIDHKKLDFYGSVTVGYSLTSEVKEFFVLKDSIARFSPSKNGFNFGAAVGVRYFMDNDMGFFLELGYERISFVSAGFSYRFAEEKKKKKK